MTGNRRIASMFGGLVLAFGLTLGLAACGPNAEQDRTIETFVAMIRAGDMDGLAPRIADTVDTDMMLGVLGQIHDSDILPRAEPDSVQRLSWFGSSNLDGSRRMVVVDEYRYADRVLHLETAILRPPGQDEYDLEGFHIRVIEYDQPEEFALILPPSSSAGTRS